MVPRCSPRPGGWLRRCGALTADWHGFNVLHTAAARVGALDLGFVPGASGKSLAQMMDGGVDVLWLLGADEFDTARIGARHVRGLSGPSRRCRCGARRRDPAGRRLHREVRHLCQHRGPRAARLPVRLSAGRGARGLDDPSRVQRRDRSHACHTTRSTQLRARLEQVNPVFGRIGFLPRFGCTDTAVPPAIRLPCPMHRSHRRSTNYYQTDPISRASPTMAACTAALRA